jgi:hypothetical protein
MEADVPPEILNNVAALHFRLKKSPVSRISMMTKKSNEFADIKFEKLL